MLEFDPETPNRALAERVATMIRNWFPLRFAGVLAGLSRGRAEEWFKKGKAGETAFVLFYRIVAEAQGEVRQIERMLEEAMDELRDRAWSGEPDVAAILAAYMGLPVRPFGFVRDAVHKLHTEFGRESK